MLNAKDRKIAAARSHGSKKAAKKTKPKSGKDLLAWNITVRTNGAVCIELGELMQTALILSNDHAIELKRYLNAIDLEALRG